MNYFPLFLNLKDKEIIIFGGNKHAFEKINKLLPFGSALTVISPKIDSNIKRINGIKILEREFKTSDLDSFPPFVVIAEEEEKTAFIYSECKKRHILVNAVDKPSYCDIIFPSVISTEHLCIGISSGGISPTATVEFKEQFENLIPDSIDSILEWMSEIRTDINNSLPKEKRKSALRKVFKAALLKGKPLEKDEFENTVK